MENLNDRRIIEGEASVLCSSDALANDPLTAASDTVANIMHWVEAAGLEPALLLERATRTFRGDKEDPAPSLHVKIDLDEEMRPTLQAARHMEQRTVSAFSATPRRRGR